VYKCRSAVVAEANISTMWCQSLLIDNPQSDMVYNFSWFCLSVCLSVCHTITFESLEVGSSYLHMRCISRQYGSSSYMKVIGSRSRSQDEKRSTTIQNSHHVNLHTSTNPDPRSVKIPSLLRPIKWCDCHLSSRSEVNTSN